MKFKDIIDNLNGNTRRRAKVRVAIGTLIGLIVGADAGLLLAPKSGYAIRKDIKHGAEWSAEKARETARKTAEFVKQASVSKTAEFVKDAATLVNMVSDENERYQNQFKYEKQGMNDTQEKPEVENRFANARNIF